MIELAAAAATAVAFVLAVLATFMMRNLAFATGFIAFPRDDRHSRSPKPLLGGVAILLAVLLPSLLALALAAIWLRQGPPSWLPGSLAVHLSGVVAKTPMALGILAGAVALHVLGLMDDRRRLGPWVKLAVQVGVAGLVVFVLRIRLLEMWGQPLSSLASLLWIVIITNAFNFLDNMDGLSAGVAAICAAAMLAAAAASGQLFVGALLCLLLGALLGFLVHNFPPAGIFMGDAGSLVVGYLLAVLSILTTYYHHGPGGLAFGILTPVVVLAVPLYDTLSVIVLRLRQRLSPFVGDTRHFSHRLLRRGMSPRKAVLTIYLAAAATAIGATVLPYVDALRACLIFAQTLMIVLMIALLESADGRGKP